MVLQAFARVDNLNPSEADILEIGAGTGRAAVQALKLGLCSYAGVEPTKKLASFLIQQHDFPVIEDNRPNLKTLRDNSFEAVFSVHVLEHAPSWGDANLWCREMIRVLKPGGQILVVAPDIRDYRENFWDSDWSHGFPTTPHRVSQFFWTLNLNWSIKEVCI